MSTGRPAFLRRYDSVTLSHQLVYGAMVASIENDIPRSDTNGVGPVCPLLSLLIYGIVAAAQDGLEINPLLFQGR